MELFTARGKLDFFFITTRDFRCVHHGWHSTRRYNIQVLATHASTWLHRYSSLLQWSVPLGQRGHVAMVLCVRCTVTTDLLVWYTNTQNDFSPGAAIFSLHTLASPRGRNVNCDEKQLTGGGKKLSCSFYLYRFRKHVSCGVPIIHFCNPGVHYETPCIMSVRLYSCRSFLRRIVIWRLSASSILFFTFSNKRHDFRATKLNVKRVFWFSLHLFPQTFLILRTLDRDIITDVRKPSCNLPFISCQFLM